MNGAAKGNAGLAAAVGILRDESGRWLAGFMQNIGISTSIRAELWAVRSELTLAWNKMSSVRVMLMQIG